MKKAIILVTIIGFTAALSAMAGDAKENYDKLCAKCHGADGKGETQDGPETWREGLHGREGSGGSEG